AIKAGKAGIGLTHHVGFGRFGKALPRDDASGLIGGFARRQAHFGQVVVKADRPAHRIGRRHPRGQRLARDAITHQMHQVERALTVPGDHDGQARIDPRDEGVERGQHIAIGHIQRRAARWPVSQERAQGRLSIARRPDFGRRAERRGQPAQQRFGPPRNQ
ncbi:hypothetical protein KXW38_002091, partial [Aspergillus fumigatus]